MSWISSVVVVVAIFYGQRSFAETRYILLDPGAGHVSNYGEFYNNVRNGYEVLKSLGQPVTVFAKDGHWKLCPKTSPLCSETKLSDLSLTTAGRRSTNPNDLKIPTYPMIKGPVRDVSDLKRDLRSAFRNVKPYDHVVIYITGHGGQPFSTASSSSITGWSHDITFAQLQKLISQLPKTVTVKLVTTTCFGGGIHTISRHLNNVCSASTTNFFTESFSNIHEGKFDKRFFDDILKKKGRTSLAQASLEGFLAQERFNPDQAELSSFDYVDYVLKTGPYSPDHGQPEYGNSSAGDPDLQSTLPSENKIDSTAGVLPQSWQSSCNCQSHVVQSDLQKTQKLAKTLSDILSASIKTQNTIKNQPPQLQTVFNLVINDLNKNGNAYEATVKKYQQKFRDLQNQLEKKYQDQVVNFTRESYGGWSGRQKMDLKFNAKAQKQFDELMAQASADPLIKRYTFDHHIVQFLKRLKDFDQVATAKQKRKFVELLQCEWEPL